MTYKQFLLKVQQAGMSLNEREGNYYYNLWVDSVNYGRKNTAAKPEIGAYITWMKKQCPLLLKSTLAKCRLV